MSLPAPSRLSSPASGLPELHRRLAMADIPPPTRHTLRLATWNIRELGKTPRLDAAIELLAAVVASFDLVSVVELRDNLDDLRRLLSALGPRWRAVFSDYCLDAGGNRERVGFLFNTRRVSFTGLASHAEAAREREGDEYTQPVPWWRPPFLASFAAGPLSFVLVAAHLRWGRTVAGREAEASALAAWATRRLRERSFASQDLALVGDFNLPSQRSPVWPAFTAAGFTLPADLDTHPGTNLAANKRYDRILWKSSTAAPRLTGRSGVADFYQGSHQELLPGLSKEAFTFQVSDHLPVWVEVGW